MFKSMKGIKLTRNLAYILGVAFLIASVVTNLVPPQSAVASPGSGAIWTTTVSCGAPQNSNIYSTGDHVFINGAGFDAGVYQWEITGNPGGASGDPHPPDAPVASGSFTVGASGAFCFDAYTIPADDWGEYSVDFGIKNDNYRVNVVLEATGSILAGVCSYTDLDGSLTAVTISLSDASLTIDGTTYYNSQIIYLPPGSYSYSWTAVGEAVGSGNGVLVVGDCTPTETPSETPTDTPTPSTTPPGETPTSTPTPPVVPIPEGEALVLIPVTGKADGIDGVKSAGFFGLGLGFFGFGTILHGISRRRTNVEVTHKR